MGEKTEKMDGRWEKRGDKWKMRRKREMDGRKMRRKRGDRTEDEKKEEMDGRWERTDLERTGPEVGLIRVGGEHQLGGWRDIARHVQILQPKVNICLFLLHVRNREIEFSRQS
jgi:hypothetical protein